jgi:hypothetical protein
MEQSRNKKQDEKLKIKSLLEEKLKITDINDLDIDILSLKFKEVFKIKSLLGVGAFGVALEVLNKMNNEVSALKVPIFINLISLDY